MVEAIAVQRKDKARTMRILHGGLYLLGSREEKVGIWKSPGLFSGLQGPEYVGCSQGDSPVQVSALVFPI